MSNVTWAERQIKVYELAVPNPATRRDLSDLLRLADKRLAELGLVSDASSPGFSDDAYTIEARGEQIVAVIKVDAS